MNVLLLLLPLYRTGRNATREVVEEYSESAFDWSSVFYFMKWVLVVAAAIAVIILAFVGVMVLVEVYKAQHSYLRSIRHKSYRAAVRGLVREMVDEQMDQAREEMRAEVQREMEIQRHAAVHAVPPVINGGKDKKKSIAS